MTTSHQTSPARRRRITAAALLVAAGAATAGAIGSAVPASQFRLLLATVAATTA
jgi:hypothetical protein